MQNKVLLLICGLIVLTSCAHRSGHTRQHLRSSHSQTVNSRQGKNEAVAHIGKQTETLLPTEIFKLFNKAVFIVMTTDGEQAFQGSGFFIGEHGLAVSNYHVFQGTLTGLEKIKMVGSETLYEVIEVIHKDSERDFILFRVNCENSCYIPIAGEKPAVGAKVYAIGSPKGLENTFSSGEVSQWRTNYLMQINVSIDFGSSGGALINERGQAVGITSGTLDAKSNANLNYAWSIDAVKPYLRLK